MTEVIVSLATPILGLFAFLMIGERLIIAPVVAAVDLIRTATDDE